MAQDADVRKNTRTDEWEEYWASDSSWHPAHPRLLDALTRLDIDRVTGTGAAQAFYYAPGGGLSEITGDEGSGVFTRERFGELFQQFNPPSPAEQALAAQARMPFLGTGGNNLWAQNMRGVPQPDLRTIGI